jgi:hypothetical protein
VLDAADELARQARLEMSFFGAEQLRPAWVGLGERDLVAQDARDLLVERLRASQWIFSRSPGFQVCAKNALVGPYRRRQTKKPFSGTVAIQFLPAPGAVGPK